MSFGFRRYEPPTNQALLAPAWAQAPRDLVPGLTGIRLEVVGSGGSVRIHSIEAYPSGFLMTIESRLAQRRLSAAELRSAARVRQQSTNEREIHDRMLGNIAFTDRTSFRIEDAKWPPRDPSTPAPSGMQVILLYHSGGSAGDFVSIMARRLWFTRLPSSGQVSVTVAWTGVLAGRRRLSFNADTIIEAASTVVPAW
ncbi:MAG TPA: hypothetical protein VKF14_13960 [Candidatus Dormibacteraeota bacterium]|nr:hypothetical protein [Candidatus Dormibacteraeota bacterium]